MSKTLYSLMLSEDVVREIDIMAHTQGTNRSNLINQILADYVSVMTPERRIEEIFSAVESLMTPYRDIVPFFLPNQSTMSFKSSLEYKYRPTVKYEVELYRTNDGSLGELSVIFRTQSAELLSKMTDFFRLWKRIEDIHFTPADREKPEYMLYDGRLTRSISISRDRDYSSNNIGEAISEYIKLFDSMMKNYINDRLSPIEIENEYVSYLNSGHVII